MSLNSGDVTMIPQNFFWQGCNEIEYKKKQAKCFKVNKIKRGDFTNDFTKLTSFGPYFKTAVQIFSRMDLTIGQ